MKRFFFFFFFIYHTYATAQLQQYLDSLAKHDVKVGLVLSGGGAKGFAHLAVLEAIEKTGVRVDYIGGTSMGAIIGGLYASGYSAKQLNDIFNSIDFEKLIQDELPRKSYGFYEKDAKDRYLISLPFSKGKVGFPASFSKGNNLYNLLTQLTFPVRKIDDFQKLPIPFLCIATDIETGEEILLEHGNLTDAIMASASFPTLFAPVEIDGRLLTDGGVLNNYPVDEILNKGVDVIIGVDIQAPLHKRNKIDSAMGILMQITSYKIANDMNLKREKTDIYIKPNMGDYNVISFAQGNAIIDSGRVAVAKKIPLLQNLANKQKNKSYLFPRPIVPDSLLISNVSFSGNNHYSPQYLRGKLRFSWNEKISFSELNTGILNLVATENFKSIRYQLCSEGDGEHIHFNLVENPHRTHFRGALHYDKLFKTGVLLNFTTRSFLQKNNVISLDFIAGDNIRYKFDYYVDNGFYTSYGIRSELNRFNRDIPHKGFAEEIGTLPPSIEEVDTEYNDLTNQIYIQTFFREKFLMGLGLEHRYISVFSNTFSKKDNPLEKTNFFSSYGYLTFDSLDDRFVPTEGVYFNGKTNWYLFSKGKQNNLNPFLLTNVRLGGAFSASNRLSFYTEAAGGFNIGLANTNTLSFLFGGEGYNFFGNITPFVGYDYLSFGSYNYIKMKIDANYRVYKKNYINFTANFANIGEDLFTQNQWVSLPKHTGYGLGLLSKTFLGPLGIKYSFSPETKKSVWLFHLGYWF